MNTIISVKRVGGGGNHSIVDGCCDGLGIFVGGLAGVFRKYVFGLQQSLRCDILQLTASGPNLIL
jgi:hypothetical protein